MRRRRRGRRTMVLRRRSEWWQQTREKRRREKRRRRVEEGSCRLSRLRFPKGEKRQTNKAFRLTNTHKFLMSSRMCFLYVYIISFCLPSPLPCLALFVCLPSFSYFGFRLKQKYNRKIVLFRSLSVCLPVSVYLFHIFHSDYRKNLNCFVLILS